MNPRERSSINRLAFAALESALRTRDIKLGREAWRVIVEDLGDGPAIASACAIIADNILGQDAWTFTGECEGAVSLDRKRGLDFCAEEWPAWMSTEDLQAQE